MLLVQQEKAAGNYLIEIYQTYILRIIYSEHGASASANPASIKERLLGWCQQATKGYKVSCYYFSSNKSIW
jgi:hypothetical protein